jgi:hypothetical protein
VTVGGDPFGCDIEPLGDGAVLNNTTRPMPDGQTQPALGAIVEDAAAVAITCHGSDSIVVEETGFGARGSPPPVDGGLSFV